jgi:endonuclease YncB( thermonuclease family)
MVIPFQAHPRAKRFRRGRSLFAALVAAAVAALATLVGPTSEAPAVVPSNIRVVDGDTIDALAAPGPEEPAGAGRMKRYRLVGFDTPETVQAGCGAELALGERAKERLRELVASGPVRLAVNEGHTDRWGRGLATLTVGGRDVGTTLIREGLAVPYSGKGRRIDWCEKLRG